MSTRLAEGLVQVVRPRCTFAPRRGPDGNLDLGEVELLRRARPRPPSARSGSRRALLFAWRALGLERTHSSSRFQALRQLRPALLALGGQACGLGLQVGGVVALVGVEVPAVHLADPLGHVVEEVAVVRDARARRRGRCVRMLFEPEHRLGVQVVRGLVEQQQVGRFQKQAAQRHATALAAGKDAHRRVGVGALQRVHGLGELAVQVPCVGGVDLGLQLAHLVHERVEVGVGRGHLLADLR